MKHFTLHIPKDIESQLRRCRASIRQSIRNRLQAIVESLAARSKAKGKANGKANGKLPAQHGPPTRFYVFEGYRVSYHVDPLTRRVVVLSLQAETS